jgi:hypothetical protein
MTETNPQNESGDSSAPVAKLDLSKYRTGELAQQIAELISIPKVFWKIAKATVLVGLLLTVACILVFMYSQITLAPWLVVCGYALIAGGLLGFMLGVLHVLSNSLRTIGGVLTIVLEITGKAAGDYDQLQAGAARLPSGGELFEQVYEDVILPMIEKSVARLFGILGTPLLWGYRWTIGPAVRYVVRRVRRSRLTQQEERDMEAAAASGLASASAYAEQITRFTTVASRVIEKTGRAMRWFLMVPLYVLFVLALWVAVVPIVIVRLFVAGQT